MLAPGNMVVSFRAVWQVCVMQTRQLATKCKMGVAMKVRYGVSVNGTSSMAEAER